MTKEDYDKMSPEERKKLLQKCEESPAYFYNNFIRRDDQPEFTDEDFMKVREYLKALPKYLNVNMNWCRRITPNE